MAPLFPPEPRLLRVVAQGEDSAPLREPKRLHPSTGEEQEDLFWSSFCLDSSTGVRFIQKRKEMGLGGEINQGYKGDRRIGLRMGVHSSLVKQQDDPRGIFLGSLQEFAARCCFQGKNTVRSWKILESQDGLAWK